MIHSDACLHLFEIGDDLLILRGTSNSLLIYTNKQFGNNTNSLPEMYWEVWFCFATQPTVGFIDLDQDSEIIKHI